MSYEWDNKKATAQMLGRFQPFHEGHYALFEEIIKKTGQVCIEVRDVQGVADNPFNFETIKKGRYDDTNAMFVKPEKFDFNVTTQDAKNWAAKIVEKIK